LRSKSAKQKIAKANLLMLAKLKTSQKNSSLQTTHKQAFDTAAVPNAVITLAGVKIDSI